MWSTIGRMVACCAAAGPPAITPATASAAIAMVVRMRMPPAIRYQIANHGGHGGYAEEPGSKRSSVTSAVYSVSTVGDAFRVRLNRLNDAATCPEAAQHRIETRLQTFVG